MRPERHTGHPADGQSVVLINFTHKPFQLSGSFLCRCQPPPFFPDVAVLLTGLGLLYFPDEHRPVGLGIIADGLEHIRHQGQDYLFRDTMLGRTASANGDFAVLGASVLRGTLAVVGAVNIHLAAAIGTVDQPGQRRGLTKTVRIAFGVAPDALHTVEGFLVDDGLMGILEPCVDNRDAARKQKNKITYFKQKRNIETGKEIKKLVFSK